MDIKSKLTMISIHLFSFQAPQHPRNEITATSTPAAIITLDPDAFGTESVMVT